MMQGIYNIVTHESEMPKFFSKRVLGQVFLINIHIATDKALFSSEKC